MLARQIALLGLCLLLAAPLPAQDVPPPLRDWQGWVLHDVPQHACPFLANQSPGADSYQCAWPGRLALDAGKDGATFSLDVHVDAPGWVALPGDEHAWPQAVTSNNQPAVVLQHDDQPMLWLAPGDYQLRGTLPWSERPARLRVPTEIGLVALSLDGAAVARVERNGDELTLGEAAAAQRVADALSLRVYRELGDGLPAMLLTQLQLDVAGSAREVVLGPALPAGFVAAALSGDLPAKLESDGRLRVQLRPGHWLLTLTARAIAPLEKVALKLPAAPWPRQEIWSYRDDPALRGSRAEGQGIDAAQAGVPGDWSDLPAFALNDGSGLTITAGARGDEGGKGDQIHLQREMWLDFDGGGLRTADHLSGELRHHQRLDVTAPWQLQRASEGGTPLLVSKGSDGRSGVELRTRKLDLDAGLRLPVHGGAIPSSGWRLPLEGISASLHLPFGYRLIAAPGADRAPDTWVAQWSLLDLFVLALVALLAGRLLGWRWALLAALYLALGRHESGAPLWTLAVVLLLALLLRALPDGRLRVAARGAAIAVFALAVLWSLPFAARQLQYALHPQLEGGASIYVQFADAMHNPGLKQEVRPQAELASSNAVPPPPPAPPAPPSVVLAEPAAPAQPAPRVRTNEQYLSSVVVTATALQSPGLDDFDSRSTIQAGAGTPGWDQGNDYQLGWSGPVTAEQTTRLLIAPRWLVRLLRVAMVALLAALLAKLLASLRPWRLPWTAARGAGVAGALLLAVALLPSISHAQSLPNQQLLDQLKARLTEAPKCAPDCASVAQAQLQASGDTLDVALEVAAGATVALPLPQPDAALQLLDASVDGHPAALVRDDDALLRLDRGVHRIGLRYRIGTVDSASLRFALRPQRVAFNGQGWSLDGVDGGRMLGDSLALQRVRVADNGGPAVAAQDFPPYVRLTRRLLLGVDWRVENTVERIAPANGGFSLSLPLLPGEHPQGDGALVKSGRIDVTFNAGSDTVRWTSRLDHAAKLALRAPALGERVEVWEIVAAPMWHVDAQGVPTSASDAGLRFQPLPGETLQLGFSQPVAVGGGSLAFDNVVVQSKVGERSTETTLALTARSTRGGEHAITLPAGAELLEAGRDGEPLNLAVRNGKLGLPLLPSEHDYRVRLREPHGIAARTRTPAFALEAPVANIATELDLPQDRWVLWTWGPTTGPAVLYWSQLVVLLLVAWLLARYAPTPLRYRHWLLLGLGFSAFAWGAYALVAAWLILLGLRARWTPPERLRAKGFNLAQLGLALLTVLALLVLVAAVPKGLLGVPDMHVAGNGSDAWRLRWFADQSGGALPVSGVLSVSLWWYKLAMLAWALWLAFALIGWLQWAFGAWTHGGYWHRSEPKSVTPPPPPPLPPSPGEAPRG
ncbi:hypothetical protein B0E52_05285 [Rhodanobacter sp. C06]|uniref:hypothetical protein n=1 Tax=Rhodanobacter sp. C06 TaxID=1945854 RepID=UPI000987AD9F|nr:hypothetical protein [Rhodanobacter sp. C06]OOG46114.1 hypothetical protein B0E52_05285 [Rhodanobacter sp. C06]